MMRETSGITVTSQTIDGRVVLYLAQSLEGGVTELPV